MQQLPRSQHRDGDQAKGGINSWPNVGPSPTPCRPILSACYLSHDGATILEPFAGSNRQRSTESEHLEQPEERRYRQSRDRDGVQPTHRCPPTIVTSCFPNPHYHTAAMANQISLAIALVCLLATILADQAGESRRLNALAAPQIAGCPIHQPEMGARPACGRQALEGAHVDSHRPKKQHAAIGRSSPHRIAVAAKHRHAEFSLPIKGEPIPISTLHSVDGTYFLIRFLNSQRATLDSLV
jgi:hypothetical protein